jgi:TPP-dependent pyruvate/acetoin dehydrogenase alpha subunit
VHSESVDGQDVRAVYSAAKRLVERARKGEGPAFLMANTYRFMGHHVGDISREYYRSKQEEQTWKTERDPLKVVTDAILAQNIADQAALSRIQTEVKAEIEKAVQFAMTAPYPSADKVEQDVYA